MAQARNAYLQLKDADGNLIDISGSTRGVAIDEYRRQALAMQSELETRYELWRWKVWVPSPEFMPFGMECYYDLGLFKIEAEITINGACAPSSFIISQERITESGSWLDTVPDLLAAGIIKLLFGQR